MQLSAELGYLGLEVGSMAAWRQFADSILGLGIGEARADGSLPLRLDGHDHRFLLREGPADDVAFIGWQVAGPAELAALIHFRDPEGLRIEAFHGPEAGSPGWRPTKMASGFHTDGLEQGPLN